MEESYIFEFLRNWGYLVMLPLMTIEGPVATIIAAMFASFGFFNVFWVFLLSVLGDVLGDIMLYLAGYFWGMGFVRKVGKYLGITEKLVLKMEKYFSRHGGKTILAVKSTTGLCWATFAAAGVVRMDFRKFLLYSVLGGLVWSGFLVFMGYFYGYLWQEIKVYIQWAGWAVSAAAIATFFIITLYKKRQAGKILQENNGLEK